MKLEELKKLCVAYVGGDEDDWLSAWLREGPKLIAVAEAAKRNADFWVRQRPHLPDYIRLSVIDPEFKFPDSLGLAEALAALESDE